MTGRRWLRLAAVLGLAAMGLRLAGHPDLAQVGMLAAVLAWQLPDLHLQQAVVRSWLAHCPPLSPPIRPAEELPRVHLRAP